MDTQQTLLQLMYNIQFKGFKNIGSLGDMCVVKIKKLIEGKLNHRGTVGLFVGYPKKNKWCIQDIQAENQTNHQVK
jgi:hypothetical protein